MNAILHQAPADQTIDDFVIWFSETTDLAMGESLSFDLSLIDPAAHDTASAVVQASGHRLAGGAQSPTRSTAEPTTNLFIGETVFADIEKRQYKLNEFLTYFSLALESISKQTYVESTRYLHFVYVSVDKVRELISIAKFINKLNAQSAFAELRLVPFSHPEGGYPAPANGQIDGLMRPSVTGERPKELFSKAWRNLGDDALEQCELFVRATLDDDDIWMPWTVSEFVLQCKANWELDGGDVRCIGNPNQLLYYPLENGRIDLVPMRMIMNGSKCATSRSWELIEPVHPWKLPEPFSQNVARQLRHWGIDLRVAYQAKPCFMYVRRHGRLSALTKYEHYRQEPITATNIGSEDFALESARELVQRSFVRAPAEFGIDPPTLTARGKMDEESHLLNIDINVDEMIPAHGLEAEKCAIEVTCRTSDGEQQTRYPLQGRIEVDVSGWEGRSGLAVWDISKNERLFSTWIRGAEKFLS